MVFPFVKLFATSKGGPPPETLFETLTSVMLNWARGWFDRFPHPPVGLLVRMQVGWLKCELIFFLETLKYFFNPDPPPLLPPL